MNTVTTSQARDAIAYAEGLEAAVKAIPKDPEWGGGMRLWLPDVIPLSPDFKGELPVIWLVANDFEGYDVTTVDPKAGS